MYDISKYKSENIVVYDTPVEVDCINWGYSHPNCDALFIDGEDISKMKIVGYGLNESGNKELRGIIDKIPKLQLFVGVDKSMLNFSGGLL